MNLSKRQVQKSDRINSDPSPRIDIKKMLRPQEITLALILKLTLVKSGQTSNFFWFTKPFFAQSQVSEVCFAQ